MPLSRLDLPHIVEAIRELHRTIAQRPAEDWQPPTWLVEQYKQTTLGEAGVPEKPSHAWLIDTAAVEVLNRLMPPWHHRSPDCPEITESRLDPRQKVKLIELRKLLLSFALGQNLVNNRSEALEVLAILETVIEQLNDQPSKGTDAPPIQGPFHTQMRDGSSGLLNPLEPGVKYLGGITNTAHTGVGWCRPAEAGFQLVVYEIPGPKYIQLSWGGSRIAPVFEGKEVTPTEAAAEFVKDGRPIPPGLPLPKEPLTVVQADSMRDDQDAGRTSLPLCPQWLDNPGNFRSIPPPPPSVQTIQDSDLRQRARDAWLCACRLRTIIDVWRDWFHELRTKGDADSGAAFRLSETASICARALWDCGAKIPTLRRDGSKGIVSKLPDRPVFDVEEWQNNQQFIDTGLARLRGLYRFQGELATFMTWLVNSPSTAFGAPPTGQAEGAAAARDQGETGQAEGIGAERDQIAAEATEGAGAYPEQATEATGEKKLSPSREKAYQQFHWAVKTNAELDGATDHQVYDWLAGHLDEDELLPSYSNWSRYLREARAAYDTRKHNRRAGRETGPSIVRPDEI